MRQSIYFLSTLLLFFVSCNNAEITNNEKTGSGSEPEKSPSQNYLTMKIDGVEWKAEREIFGAFHPLGYNSAIIIAGSKGSNNKDEQSFNINLYNTSGQAIFNIKEDNADKNVVQLLNMSPEHFMYGSMMGFDMKIVIIKSGSNPEVIEATFEGELTGNASDKLKITEGKFYYHE